MRDVLISPPRRLVFPHIDAPDKVANRFRATLDLPYDDPWLGEIADAIYDVYRAHFGRHARITGYQPVRMYHHNPFRALYRFHASSLNRPYVIDETGMALHPSAIEADQTVSSHFTLSAFDMSERNQRGILAARNQRGVRAHLQTVQFVGGFVRSDS